MEYQSILYTLPLTLIVESEVCGYEYVGEYAGGEYAAGVYEGEGDVYVEPGYCNVGATAGLL